MGLLLQMSSGMLFSDSLRGFVWGLVGVAQSILRKKCSCGQVLKGQHEYERSLEHYEKALAIKEKARGADHADTLSTVFNMAQLAKDSGDADGAKAMFVRCAEGNP